MDCYAIGILAFSKLNGFGELAGPINTQYVKLRSNDLRPNHMVTTSSSPMAIFSSIQNKTCNQISEDNFGDILDW